MDKFICEFCNSELKSEPSLKAHINGSKRCLKNRGLKLKTKHECMGCNLNFLTRNNLTIHCETCKKFSDLQNEQTLKEKDRLIQSLTKENDELKFVKEQLTISKVEYLQKIEHLEKRIDTITIEAINRPTTKTINNIRNNLSMTYTLDDIKESDLNELFLENLTEKVFMSGHKGLAKLCTDKIINTQDSKKLTCCTDITRKKFKYMDKNGNVNEDVEARAFVEKVTKPIKEAGKQVYDTMLSNINEERNKIREDDHGKKERLIDRSFQVMNKYQDIINIDDPKYNGDFTNELAILNKN